MVAQYSFDSMHTACVHMVYYCGVHFDKTGLQYI